MSGPICIGPVRLHRGDRARTHLNYSLNLDVVHRRDVPEIHAAVGELLPDLGLKPTRANREALSVLVGNLFTCWLTIGGPYLSMPMAKADYGPGSRLRALFMKFGPMTSAVRALHMAEYIELHAGVYTPGLKRRTRIRATPKLAEVFLRHRLRLDHFKLGDDAEVELRDTDKRPINIDRGAHAHAAKPIKASVRRINQAVAAAEIHLDVDEQLFIDKYLNRIDGKKACHAPNPLKNHYCRIFNGSFTRGGRFFRHWTQSVPSELRQFLRINGEPVQEVDYRGIHPTMLYLRRGLPIPDGELYLPPGWPDKLRPAFKTLMLAAINAPDLDRAVRGARDGIRQRPELRRIEKNILRDSWLYSAFEALKLMHAGIGDGFFTGVGIELQNLDSRIAESVMLRLLDRGVVSLCIHDSFVVGASHTDKLVEAMTAASLEVCGTAIPVKVEFPFPAELPSSDEPLIENSGRVMDGPPCVCLGYEFPPSLELQKGGLANFAPSCAAGCSL